MAQPETGNWSDLRTRIISAAVLAIVGIAGIALGGLWFQVMVTAAIGIIVWEIWTMISPEQSGSGPVIAILGAASVFETTGLPTSIALALLLTAPVIGAVLIRRHGLLFGLYAWACLLAGWALIAFRAIPDVGLVLILLLVLIVVVSDSLGYFAGRILGGPKFWPAISPKKTWSGTIAGWIGAALIGFVMILWGWANWIVMPAVVLVALAGQLGDIAESALKRRMGIKDSSNLIPGHGGFYDRFDALIGAALMMFVFSLIGGGF